MSVQITSPLCNVAFNGWILCFLELEGWSKFENRWVLSTMLLKYIHSWIGQMQAVQFWRGCNSTPSQNSLWRPKFVSISGKFAPREGDQRKCPRFSRDVLLWKFWNSYMLQTETLLTMNGSEVSLFDPVPELHWKQWSRKLVSRLVQGARSAATRQQCINASSAGFSLHRFACWDNEWCPAENRGRAY